MPPAGTVQTAARWDFEGGRDQILLRARQRPLSGSLGTFSRISQRTILSFSAKMLSGDRMKDRHSSTVSRSELTCFLSFPSELILGGPSLS